MFNGNEVVFFNNVYNHCPDNDNIVYIGNEMQLGVLNRNLKKTTNSSQL